VGRAVLERDGFLVPQSPTLVGHPPETVGPR
jgi:hypothetical protein